MSDSVRSGYRWNILALAAASHTFAAAIPYSSLPALFKEISEDLNLSLVQIGTVWGIISLAGVFTTLMGGLLGDHIGPKRTLTLACIMVGLTGASRGLSGSFVSLAATVFAFGLVRSVIPPNVHKTVATWFQGKNLGMANGVVAMGMGIGLSLGPLISAAWLSPLLGGWRNVLFLYGAVSVMVGILWAVVGKEHHSTNHGGVPLREALSGLLRIKRLWLLGFTLMFRLGCIMGMTGYLPLYLRGQGWSASSADGTLAAFFAASFVAVIPLTWLSDRLGSRKAILFPGLLTGVAGIGLLAVANDAWVWVVMLLVGMFMDGFMAISLTMVQETPGVGPRYTGMAVGLVLTISMMGAFVSPPLGNSLAGINGGLPFVFWAGLGAVPFLTLALTRETGPRGRKTEASRVA